MTRLYIAGGILAGLILFGFACAAVGDYRAQVRITNKAKDNEITVLKGGKKVDDEVFGADRSGLCDLLGGC